MWAMMSVVLGSLERAAHLQLPNGAPPSGRNYEETSKTREKRCLIESSAEEKDPSSAEADLHKVPGQKR
jgi:hypothetical protein